MLSDKCIVKTQGAENALRECESLPDQRTAVELQVPQAGHRGEGSYACVIQFREAAQVKAHKSGIPRQRPDACSAMNPMFEYPPAF